MFNLRRYSASGVYYGERVITGTARECLDWLRPVIERRCESGWECNLVRNMGNERTFEFTHDDRADVHYFTLERFTEGKE